VVGFAAETHDSEDDRLAAAQEKLSVKNADVIVLNQVGVQIGFGPVRTAVTLIFRASPQSLTFEGTKHSVAGLILDALLDR
jgi:phosphopantothenoylcysteine decarboxylase/phosphopantothenate--cysteine ligase